MVLVKSLKAKSVHDGSLSKLDNGLHGTMCHEGVPKNEISDQRLVPLDYFVFTYHRNSTVLYIYNFSTRPEVEVVCKDSILYSGVLVVGYV